MGISKKRGQLPLAPPGGTRMRWQGKLVLGFWFVTLLAALVGAEGVVGLLSVWESDHGQRWIGLELVPMLTDLSCSIDGMQLALQRSVTEGEEARGVADLKANQANVEDDLLHYRELLRGLDDETGRSLHDQFEALWRRAARPLTADILGLVAAQQTVQARTRLRSLETTAVWGQLHSTLQDLGRYHVLQVQKTDQANGRLTTFIVQLMVGTTVLGMLLAVGLGALFARWVRCPTSENPQS